MKKVLIAVSLLTGGGAERVVSVWATQLAQKGYDVSLLLYGRSEDEYFVDDRVKIYTIANDLESYKALGYLQRFKRMRKIVKSIQPDVVISFLQRIQIWMGAATFGMKVKRVETVRINPWKSYENGGFEKKLWHNCFKKADTIIVQTGEQAEYFNEKLQKKCVVISNPIAERYCKNPKEEYSKQICKFVAMGRVTEQKNYPVMIEAFAKAKKQCPEIELAIYGTGEPSYAQSLQELIEKYGVSDCVKLMGRIPDTLPALKTADAFLMTSDFEGLPNALIEAMTVGLPCISTNCRTGPRDLIDDGENGFLTRVGDVDDIAAAIVKVAALTEQQAETMGKKAREKTLSTCSEEESLKKLIQIIEN